MAYVFDWEALATHGPEAAVDALGLNFQEMGGFFFGDAEPVARVVVGEWGEDVPVDAIYGGDFSRDVALEQGGDYCVDGELALRGSEVDGWAAHESFGAIVKIGVGAGRRGIFVVAFAVVAVVAGAEASAGRRGAKCRRCGPCSGRGFGRGAWGYFNNFARGEANDLFKAHGTCSMGSGAKRNPKKKPREQAPWAFGFKTIPGLIHPAHPAPARGTGRLGFVFLDLADDRVGRQQQSRDARGILQGGAFDLCRDDDAHFDHVAVFVGQGVVAEVDVPSSFLDLLGDDGAIDAGVFGDLFDGGFDRAADDFDADALIVVRGLLASRPEPWPRRG